MKRADRWFNDSAHWLSFATGLREVKQQEAYRPRYKSFNQFVEAEFETPKSTVAEIMLAHEYLSFRHPECLDQNRSAAEHIPSYANITLLARSVRKLPEDVVETLDHALFAGGLKRQGLKEAIKKELPQPAPAGTLPLESVKPSLSHRDLLNALNEFYQTTNLDILEEEIDVVFDDWGAENLDERRQLLRRLHDLVESLQDIRARLTDLMA